MLPVLVRRQAEVEVAMREKRGRREERVTVVRVTARMVESTVVGELNIKGG